MKAITRYFFLFGITWIFNQNIYSQFSEEGTPYSFQYELLKSGYLKSAFIMGEYRIQPVNNEYEIHITDSINNLTYSKKLYYGKIIDSDINLFHDAGKMKISSATLYLYHIYSANAHGIQLFFDQFFLPAGCKLFIYNEDKSMVLGAFTQNNNTKNKHFATQYISGNSIIIEYYQPDQVTTEPELHIDKVVHVFRSLRSLQDEWGSSDYCNIDLACEDDEKWKETGSSVALILAPNNSNNYSYWCTGSLLNNTKNDGRPLFLSASHCADDVRVIEGHDSARFSYSDWIFLFNYQKEDCSNTKAIAYNHSILGSKLLSKDDYTYPVYFTDHLLLELNTSPEELKSYNAVYAGWEANEDSAFNTSYTKCIHHPSGDVKKISTGYQPESYTSDSILEVLNNQWAVQWYSGVTESGSSGSPLFNDRYRIIGQLNGGQSYCISPLNPDFYNKFSLSYIYGQLYKWLDPLNSNQKRTNSLSFDKEVLKKKDILLFNYDQQSGLIDCVFLDYSRPGSYVYFQFCNISGQIIFEKQYPGSNRISFYVPSLARGIYFVKITYNYDVLIRKIMITKS